MLIPPRGQPKLPSRFAMGCGGFEGFMGNLDLIYAEEEDGADNELTRTAAAGNAGHGDRGEHGDDDREDRAARREVLAEHADPHGDWSKAPDTA